MSAADDEPLSDDLEEAAKILYPDSSAAERRARLRAVLKRAEELRRLDEVLFERVRRPSAGADDPTTTWAREALAGMDGRTSEELAQLVQWLEGDPARAARLFQSRFEAFQAGLRVGERL